MADQLLKQAQDLFEGQIDFEGQKQTEIFSTYLLIGSGLFALILGLVQQDIYVTLWVGLAGTVLTMLMVVPPWPMYNENPGKWLPGKNGSVGTGIEVDGKKIN
ncbi:hypothetical protein MMC22_006430 [Lobaria immixta]|nr:hypothetical protein [Lobaria immixta]